MKTSLSFFGSTDDIEAVSAAGYDGIEMQVTWIANLAKSEFKKTCQLLQNSQIVCKVLDNPVPLDKCIADESFDLNFYRDYLTMGADRAAQMGVSYYIFGNGRTRSLPATGDIEAAKEKNLSFIRMLADITAERGITVLIEPLASRVSNVILSIPEALAYIETVGKSNLGTFLDYRWFRAQHHPILDIEKYGKYIRHIHLDNPDSDFPRRVIPRLEDGHDYSPFFKALRDIDYEGIIAIEANTFTDFKQDLKDGLAFFQKFGLLPQRAHDSNGRRGF
jgi:sugar phosphate isomerase/epimerase